MLILGTVVNSTSGLVSEDPITNIQVVPEPDSALGILAFGIGGAGLLLKTSKRLLLG